MRWEGALSGTLSGDDLKDSLLSSGLESSILRNIWELADIDDDGELDVFEFAIAQHLIDGALQGRGVPNQLSNSLRPPSNIVADIRPSRIDPNTPPQ